VRNTRRMGAAAAALAILLSAGGCGGGAPTDNARARREKVAKLTDQYGCHPGDARSDDKGVMVEPRGNTGASKVEVVSIVSFDKLPTGAYSTIKFCRLRP